MGASYEQAECRCDLPGAVSLAVERCKNAAAVDRAIGVIVAPVGRVCKWVFGKLARAGKEVRAIVSISVDTATPSVEIGAYPATVGCHQIGQAWRPSGCRRLESLYSVAQLLQIAA